LKIYRYLYLSIENGQPRELALCHLDRHTFVPYDLKLAVDGKPSENPSAQPGRAPTRVRTSVGLRQTTGKNTKVFTKNFVKRFILDKVIEKQYARRPMIGLIYVCLLDFNDRANMMCRIVMRDQMTLGKRSRSLVL